MNSPVSYAQYLEALEGRAFQDEVSAHLGRHRHDVQPIFDTTGGDGGLDVCTHEYLCGYMCFGPKHQAYKSNAERASAIVEKFQKDLRKVFELKESKGTLEHERYESLEESMPDGKKIKHLFLICSWVGNKQIPRRIQNSLAKYRAASQCRFAEPDATAVVWDPKQFVGTYPVIDEAILVKMLQDNAAKRIRAAAAQQPLPASADFDDKFQWLHSRAPGATTQLTKMAQRLREAWRVAIAVDADIQRILPALHRLLGDAREAAVTDAAFTAIPVTGDSAELVAAMNALRAAFKAHVGDLLQDHYGVVSKTAADGELARMIGICDVDWRS